MFLRYKNLLSIIFVLAIMAGCSFDKSSPTQPDTNIGGKTIPNTPKPSDKAANQLLVLTLDWKADSTAKFDVYFDKQNPPQIVFLKDINAKPIIKTGLDYNTTYYWKVIAKYSDGTKVEGPVWKFTTLDQTSPAAGNGYAMFLDSIQTSAPNNVKALFQVEDLNGQGITNLQSADFEVYEDSQPLSQSESELQIKKHTGVPYTIRTVLMLDNSTSLKNEIDSIRNAAVSFINNIIPNQEVAVYQFSDGVEMLTDFTSDKNVLNNALKNYKLGYSTTNLYGAVVKGASLWDDIYSINEVIQGSMIIFTDGNDTQGSTSLSSAINAVHNKIVFTIGLGSEIQPEILDEIGTAGYYSITDVSHLASQFSSVQTKITDYSNSFYLLSYKSPKRGNNDHYLTIRIKNNPHTGENSFVTGTFSSSGFTSAKISTR